MVSITREDIKKSVLALESLETASGKLAKEAILKGNQQNQALRLLLKMSMGNDVYNVTLDNDIEARGSSARLQEDFSEFLVLADELTTRKVSGKEAEEKACTFMQSCHPRLSKWLVRTINRDLRVGVGKKLVESVFGKVFWHGSEAKERGWFYHGCMCAKDFHKVYTGKKQLEFPIGVEAKLDGERAQLFCIPQEGKVHCFSRAGHRKEEIESVDLYRNQVLKFAAMLSDAAGLPSDTPMYLDGEFLASDWNSTSSVVSRTRNFDANDFLARVRTVMWDWAPLADYVKEEFKLSWAKRKATLLLAAGLSSPTLKFTKVSANVYILGHMIVHDQETLQELYASALDHSFEGLMLKKLDAPHVFHRNHDYIVKLKPVDAKTGVIVDMLPGEGANAAASEHDKLTIMNAMSKYGAVNNDGYFYQITLESVAEAVGVVDKLKQLVHDSVDRRLFTSGATVMYRHSERLGKFIVETDGKRFAVGGGLKYKANADERMDFWRRRKDLIGRKMDYKVNDTKTATVVARNNRYVRLREDL